MTKFEYYCSIIVNLNNMIGKDFDINKDIKIVSNVRNYLIDTLKNAKTYDERFIVILAFYYKTKDYSSFDFLRNYYKQTIENIFENTKELEFIIELCQCSNQIVSSLFDLAQGYIYEVYFHSIKIKNSTVVNELRSEAKKRGITFGDYIVGAGYNDDYLKNDNKSDEKKVNKKRKSFFKVIEKTFNDDVKCSTGSFDKIATVDEMLFGKIVTTCNNYLKYEEDKADKDAINKAYERNLEEQIISLQNNKNFKDDNNKNVKDDFDPQVYLDELNNIREKYSK